MVVFRLALAVVAFALTGCADPDWRGSAGGQEKTALALPDFPTVDVPNPFFCPGPPS